MPGKVVSITRVLAQSYGVDQSTVWEGRKYVLDVHLTAAGAGAEPLGADYMVLFYYKPATTGGWRPCKLYSADAVALGKNMHPPYPFALKPWIHWRPDTDDGSVTAVPYAFEARLVRTATGGPTIDPRSFFIDELHSEGRKQREIFIAGEV